MAAPRIVSRLLVVGGILLFVVTWRIDQAVRTAYDTGWLARGKRTGQYACDGCLRLPTDVWVGGHVVVSALALLALLSACLLWRRRFVQVLEEAHLGRTTVVLAAVAAASASVAAAARGLAGAGAGKQALGVATFGDALAIASVAAIALATVNLVYGLGNGSLAGALRRTLQRQRMNMLLVGALVAALTLIPDTSGQAIDSIRTWNPIEIADGEISRSSPGAARFFLGIATALLLTLVLYESGVRLLQAPSGTETPPPARRLRYAGGAFVLVGGVLWLLTGGGGGIALAGVFMLLLALLELPDVEGEVISARPEVVTEAELRAPEWIAIAPLVALASASAAATVEAALSGGVNAGTLAGLLPAAALGALAVFFTAEGPPPRVLGPQPRLLVAVAATLIVLTVALILVSSVLPNYVAGLTALLAAAAVSALLVYAFRLVHRPPPTWGAPWRAYSFAIAVGAGLAVFLGVHLRPLDAGRLLGVFALANVALAFTAVALHLAVATTLRTRPPKLLWWFHLRQLPVLSILLLWWIGLGFTAPKTLHEVRLVDRQTVVTADGETELARPQLADAFDAWVAAQPELRDPSREREVPLVLVAAHGGGIRAAYWTAAALDCIVGVSADGVTESDFGRESDEFRERTCTSPRRSAAQQRAAARRIFLASGVSGGAVGLYAYARQLLHNGELGDGTWFEQRLSDDFASPAVGWALFHDLPNRVLGLHSDDHSCSIEFQDACWSEDRAAVLERGFDSSWNVPAEAASLRHAYDLRSAVDPITRRNAQTLPLLVMNTTLTGGSARGVVSAVDLGSWPTADSGDPATGDGRLPLAGTVEVVDAVCDHRDLRLSSAAVLAARFPYVTPSGQVRGACGTEADDGSPACGPLRGCEGRFVDGGYIDNSGLFTIVAVWPSLRRLIVEYNSTHTPKIAPLILELDNHYQASSATPVPAGGPRSEFLIPPLTAMGGRTSVQTYARAAAYRALPPSCTVTISPSLHPGLIAPLGWELSERARKDLRDGLFAPHPGATKRARNDAVFRLRQAQARIAAASEQPPVLGPQLADCAQVVTAEASARR